MRYIYQNLIVILLLHFSLKTNAQINGSFSFGGQTRTFITYLPAGYTPGEHLPLVFALHGFTQSASGIMGYSKFNDLADNEHFIVVYPNGVNNSWNTFTGLPGSSTADDVGFINALIDTMSAQYQIDEQRVYSCGLSAGGYMSHRLACELEQRITAIASVAGTMTAPTYSACTIVRPVPVLQIHGTADAIVAYNGGFGGKSVDEVLGLWTSLDTCVTPPLVAALPDLVTEGSTVERHTWAPCSSNTQVQLLKIINGGHTWPSAVFSGIGNTNQDIDASVEIWNFFKQFTLNATSTTSEQWLQNDIQVFPNPAQTQVSITSENSQNTLEKVRIWDLSGKLLADSGPLATATCQLPLNSIHNGMVIVEVQSQRGTYYSRLMVQK